MSERVLTTVQKSGFGNGKPVNVTVGHFLGGSSTHNRLCYIRACKQDLDEWTALGNKGWSYRELLPYMIALESYDGRAAGDVTRGARGPIKVTRESGVNIFYPYRKRWRDATALAGYEFGDYNGPRQVIFSDTERNIGRGIRQSTDNAYLKPILGKRKNLDVIMFSRAQKIIFNKAGDTAIGIEYSRNGQTHKVMANKEVILSGGTFGTPHLLMLSGIGPKEQLQKANIKVVMDLPGVGQNLQDHNYVNVSVTSTGKFPDNTQVDKENFDLWSKNGSGILGTTPFISQGYITTKHSVNSDDSQIWLLLGMFRNSDPSKALLGMTVSTSRTYSLGTLTLNTTNPSAALIKDPKYLSNSKDKDNLITGMKAVLGLMGSKPFQDINAKLIVDGKTKKCSKKFTIYSDEWLYCFIKKNGFSAYHYTSTCKMGPKSDPMAVVNDQLQVRGIKQLRIIDASVMPQSTRGSTNAPSMMIGLKGAALVRKQYLI